MNPQIISKEGGLLLKDNLEGGATWAYEVGSQSMVCPIIVEDLNQPRQMLVEVGFYVPQNNDPFVHSLIISDRTSITGKTCLMVLSKLSVLCRCFARNGAYFWK